MMSNKLLCEAIIQNPIHLRERSGILTDELFGIVELCIKRIDRAVAFTIYNQLNYQKIKELYSHDIKDGDFFYIKDQKKIHIMIGSKETVSIDEKQDILRRTLYRYLK
jgi:predicted patatin/cPLA2 family phospholipase